MMVEFIKKNWFIIIIIFMCIIRYLLSCNLPSYYLSNLNLDDALMIKQLKYLLVGKYLGSYTNETLVKGMIFPFVLFIARTIKLTYSSFLTILHIGGCLFLGRSLRKLINNKYLLIISIMILMFNPISYSSESFQRLYITSISIIELLFFIGVIINIILEKNKNIFNYLFLGIIVLIMFLTRNDNIWIFVILFIIFIFKLIKDFKIKNIIFVFIPFLILFIGINLVRIINYNYYGVYTYNELEDSNFKKAYNRLLLIKDDKKIDYVAIPKSTLYKVAELTDALGIDKKDIDKYYKVVNNKTKELDNGNIIWSLRDMIYRKQNFGSAASADEFFGKLSDELDRLFREGKLEKEFSLSLIFINAPTKRELLQFPKNLLKTIWYTTSYQNIKTYDADTIMHINGSYKPLFKNDVGAYSISYRDYRNSENMGKNNIGGLELIRIIYKYLTIILSVLSIGIFLKNIKTKDYLNYITMIVLLSYILILSGVVYTHTTAFPAIRYRYLSNVYILQSLFILLSIARYVAKDSKKISSK